MECPSCGAAIRDNAVFCSSCGERVSAHTPTLSTPRRAGAWEQDDSSTMGSDRSGRPIPGPWTGGVGREAGLGGALGQEPLGRRGPDWRLFATRFARILRLDASVFREMYDDPAAQTPSLGVATVATLLMALGGWLWWRVAIGDNPVMSSGDLLVRSVIIGTVIALALWALWVWLIAAVLAGLFRRQARWTNLMRPLGFALLPLAIGLLMVLDAVIEPLRLAFGILAIVGAVLLTQIALQECTDATPGEALLANLAGFAVWAVVLSLLGRGTLNLAPGIWMFG